MKKLTILSLMTLASIGCTTATQQTTNTNVAMPNKAVVATQKPDDSTVVSSHSSGAEKSSAMPPAAGSSTSSSGASPMSKAIDVSQMTADIEKADKAYKQNQNDEKAKDKLAQAYFVRGLALTEAAQYRAALGDLRKGLKLKPDDAEAKAMHDQIIEIFQSLQREPPKEGEEPPPLPIGKN